MKTYLITGGAGFIGVNTAARLIQEGNKVIILLMQLIRSVSDLICYHQYLLDARQRAEKYSDVRIVAERALSLYQAVFAGRHDTSNVIE